MDGYTVDQKECNIASVYSSLGKAYEGEYIFDKAKEAYLQAIEHGPYYPTDYIHYAKVLVKENNLNEALKYLCSQKKSQYYESINDFKMMIDNEIDDIQYKKDTGYVYKPRKKK